MLKSQHADGFVLHSHHLIHTSNVGQSKLHYQFAIVLHQPTVTSLGKTELAFDDPKRMLNLGPYAGFKVLGF